MPVERLNPLNDYLFLKIMGEKGDEEQLLSFLNAVLGRAGDQALLSIEIIEARTLTAGACFTGAGSIQSSLGRGRTTGRCPT
ncbi:MAG: Rpn family recombination-promoting nuclease/putative transposase [Treponema sp.]|nr:Rpn family recombination-promoting nuclease/putative transposase [Treponema sp.]